MDNNIPQATPESTGSEGQVTPQSSRNLPNIANESNVGTNSLPQIISEAKGDVSRVVTPVSKKLPNISNSNIVGTNTIPPNLKNSLTAIRNNAVKSVNDNSLSKFRRISLNDVTRLGADNRTPLKVFDITGDDFVSLSDGKLIPRFTRTLPGIDNNEFLARRQSTGEKLSNGVKNMLGTIATSVIGGTLGAVNGVFQGIKEGSLSAVFDNSFNDYLDDINTKLNFKAPNLLTKQEQNLSTFESLGTANFWAKDVLGGIGFLVGTLISEGLWSVATGGTSLIAKGLASGTLRGLTFGRRTLEGLNKIKAPVKAVLRGSMANTAENLVKSGVRANKLSKTLNATRFFLTSSFFEAGMEARTFMDDAKERWRQEFKDKNGRLPSVKEIVDFENGLTNSANGVFLTNAVLVGFSNLTILGRTFLGKGERKLANSFIKRKLFGIGFKKLETGGIEALERTKLQKVFSRVADFAKPIAAEAFIEEGGQFIASEAATKHILSAYDKNNLRDSMSLVEAVEAATKDLFGTKEGLKNIVVGTIIALLGEGVGSKGKFDSISGEAKFIKENADYINQFTRAKLIANLKHSAKIRQNVINSEKAKREGNLTGEVLTDEAAMMLEIERASLFQEQEEVIKDFEAAIRNENSKELMEELGMNKEEFDEWKESRIATFKEVANTHIKSLEFADTVIGNGAILGLDKIQGLDKSAIDDLKSAIAFTTTTAIRADKLAENILNNIKEVIGIELGLDGSLDALDIDNALRKVSDDKKREFNNNKRKLDRVVREIEKLENQQVEIAKLNDQKDNDALRLKLSKITEKLEQLNKKRAQIEREKTLSFEALRVKGLDSESLITEEMLDNQEKSLDNLFKLIDDIKLRDPQRAELLGTLFSEYKSATTATKDFRGLVESMIDPKRRVAVVNNFLSKILASTKEVPGDTANTLLSILKNFNKQELIQFGREEVDRLEKEKETKEKESSEIQSKTSPKDPISIPPEDPTIQNKKEETKVPSENPTEILKEKLKEIVERDPYTNLRLNKDILSFQVEDLRPKQEDIDKYEKLISKIAGKTNILEILQGKFNDLGELNLTQQELDELRNLNRKLNSWKIISGRLGTEDSVAELLELINQYENGIVRVEVKSEVEPQDLFIIGTSEQKEANLNFNPVNTLVTPDIVVGKKVSKGKSYQISHLKPKSLTKLFPNSILKVVKGRRKRVFSELKQEEKEELSNTAGTVFILETPQGNLQFTLEEKQRLVVKIDELEKFLPQSNIKILDFGISNYLPFYIKSGEEFIPLKGDFTNKSIIDNELIVVDAERLYELKEGELLRTTVNLNDEFNNKLLQKFKRGKITESEFIEKLKINIQEQGEVSTILGHLRGVDSKTNRDTESFSKLILIRKLAAKKALSSKTSIFDVGIAIPLSIVLFGSPNLNVVEQGGEIKAVSRPITNEDLDKIEDWGYILNGEVVSNRENNYEDKELIFTKKSVKDVRNVNKKIPFVMFRYKGRRVVFPVSTTNTTINLSEDILTVLNNTTISDTRKIIEINNLLSNNGIDPRKYGLTTLNLEESEEVINQIIRDTSDIKVQRDVDRWINKDFNKEDLTKEAQISIDINRNPFNAPKGVFKFSEVVLPDIRQAEIEQIEKLNELTLLVSKRFDKDNPFAEATVNSQFFDVFEGDNEVIRSPKSFIQKQVNANILIKAFSTRLPKRVKEVLGEDLLKEIKSNIALLSNIKNNIKNTKEVFKELEKEIENEKTECNG